MHNQEELESNRPQGWFSESNNTWILLRALLFFTTTVGTWTFVFWYLVSHGMWW